MSSYNERLEWEYQDYLKQRYEEQQAAGYDGVRKIVCGGCGRVFYTTIYTKKILSQLLVRQSGQQSAAAGIPPNAPSGFSMPVLR